MKLFKLLVLLLYSSFLFVAFKSDEPRICWGTKTLYIPLQQKYTPAPTGYDPVFFNYVGRHGARFQTNLTNDSLLLVTLNLAANEHALTLAGIKLKRMDSLLINLEKDRISLISERGKMEQEAIGNRMAQQLYPIFANRNGSVQISTTKKERTRQSARAFLDGLDLDTSQHILSNYNNTDELAFYDVSPAYKNFKESGNWKKAFGHIQNLPETKELYDKIPGYFFITPFISKMNGASDTPSDKAKNSIPLDKKSFSIAVYDACAIIPSLDYEILNRGYRPEDLDMKSLFSGDDLQKFNFIGSAEDFLIKGPGTNAEGIQVRIAAPLLVSFLLTTEDYISNQKVIANLRFGHAETIAPFAALLGIKGASEFVSSDQIQDFQKSWDCSAIIPLSANIQWVLYKNNNTGNFLIKFLLNEKEVTIRELNDSGTPYYYKWSDVKDFYIRKLEKMNVHLSDNMHDYLINVPL